MIQKIINFIVANKIPLFAPVLLLIVIMLISSMRKSKKVLWLSLILSIITISGFTLDYILKNQKILGYDLIIITSGVAFLNLLINLFVYIKYTTKFNKNYKLVMSSPSNVDNQIFAYLDDKSRFVMVTGQFLDNFEGLQVNKKTLKKVISYFVCDEKKMTFKEFKEYITSFSEKNYHIKIYLIDSKVLSFDILKRKVTDSGKLLGYVLINQKKIQEQKPVETNKVPDIQAKPSDSNISIELKRKLRLYFELLDQANCYFDYEKNQYILSKTMTNILGLTSDRVEEQDYVNLVIEEDRNIILKRSITEKLTKTFYRLKTDYGFDWFEENAIIIDSKTYLVVKRTDFSKYKINVKIQSLLVDDIRNLYKENEECFLIFISLNDFQKLCNKIGKDAAEYALGKYFDKLNDYKQNIYKVGNIEYCLLIDKREKYEMILRDLNSNKSDLLDFDIQINQLRFLLKNSIGLVESVNVQSKKPDQLIAAGFEALHFATDDRYPKRYSIYYPKKTEKININESEIDLSDQFLEKILNKK